MAEVCVDVAVMVMLCAVTSTLFTSNSFGKASSGLTVIFFEPSFYKRLFIQVERWIDARGTSEHHQEWARTRLFGKVQFRTSGKPG
jgi:hypothetical protein